MNPMHERDKPADLDQRSYRYRRRACRRHSAGKLHVFHGFDVSPALAVSTDSITMPIAMPVPRPHRTRCVPSTPRPWPAADRTHRASPATERISSKAAPAQLLMTLTDQLRADAVVMGAMSRDQGMKRLFLGNTAEDVSTGSPATS